MILRIFLTNDKVDIELKDIYKEEQITEALELDSVIQLTKKDNKTVLINTSNVCMIEFM